MTVMVLLTNVKVNTAIKYIKINQFLRPCVSGIHILMAAGILLSPLPYYYVAWVKNPESTASSGAVALPGCVVILLCAVFWIYLVMAHAYFLATKMTTGCASEDWALTVHLLEGFRWYHVSLLIVFVMVLLYGMWSVIWFSEGGTVTTSDGSE